MIRIKKIMEKRIKEKYLREFILLYHHLSKHTTHVTPVIGIIYDNDIGNNCQMFICYLF